ncbi:MAG: addiction module protein [Desulfobulbaceae bacterium]|jgi:putative addiction module component (TIGR02574 family)|nr:addiction module protein [Desulfobulbaceae bacterium]
MNPDTASLFSLSPAEKLRLITDLWDDLTARPENVPIHGWQKTELHRRRSKLMENPASGLSWEDVREEARNRHGR